VLYARVARIHFAIRGPTRGISMGLKLRVTSFQFGPADRRSPIAESCQKGVLYENRSSVFSAVLVGSIG